MTAKLLAIERRQKVHPAVAAGPSDFAVLARPQTVGRRSHPELVHLRHAAVSTTDQPRAADGMSVLATHARTRGLTTSGALLRVGSDTDKEKSPAGVRGVSRA